MKPTKDCVGWCTPKDLQKFARLAARVILNRTLPDGRGTHRRQLAFPGPHLFVHLRGR